MSFSPGSCARAYNGPAFDRGQRSPSPVTSLKPTQAPVEASLPMDESREQPDPCRVETSRRPPGERPERCVPGHGPGRVRDRLASMTGSVTRVITLFACLVAGAPVTASARGVGPGDESLPGQRAPSLLAEAEVGEAAAAAAAQAATGGRVVAVRRSGANYEITVLLDDGQVRVVRVDAASGRVVGG
jgi:hypothetical protein